MKMYLDCIPCIIRQALQAARFASTDEETQEKVVRAVLETLQKCDFKKTPPEISHKAHITITEILGPNDPYQKVKEESNFLAYAMYDEHKQECSKSDDPIDTAVRLAIAGNIMDYAAYRDFDLHNTIVTVRKAKFAIDHVRKLKKELETAKCIAYLVDNAGEIVFDKLFIETVGEICGKKEWHVFVKSRPIINDATHNDAAQIGLHVVDNVTLESVKIDKEYDSRTDPEFLDYLRTFDMVISKGQGNYEILSDAEGISFFFLLMVKCPIVAGDIGVDVGDIVVLARE
jgi:uncharacterized protein with ATP-grasp and redox domains